MKPSCACRGCALAFKQGMAAGLDAAREAFEEAVTDALEILGPLDPQFVNRVLAAIDALREKP